ncbi:MAG: hypothetical protein KC492_14350, partial [Myxococcales bacterium]|nr:hypothetical protein [Myxococcales bacterium]
IHALEADGVIRQGAASGRTMRAHLYSDECTLKVNHLDPRKRLVILERDALLRVDFSDLLAAMGRAAEEVGALRESLLVRFAC